MQPIVKLTRRILSGKAEETAELWKADDKCKKSSFAALGLTGAQSVINIYALIANNVLSSDVLLFSKLGPKVELHLTARRGSFVKDLVSFYILRLGLSQYNISMKASVAVSSLRATFDYL